MTHKSGPYFFCCFEQKQKISKGEDMPGDCRLAQNFNSFETFCFLLMYRRLWYKSRDFPESFLLISQFSNPRGE